MTSAHTTLRELVTHLARAQRAFDAGHLDEAERAIADALALDPHNVQAADLRQRIRKDCQPADQGRAARAAAVRPRRSPIPVAPGASAAGRVSPTAWSTFEGRVRGRRADRAVADAQEALGRGDAEAAQAALEELDAISPGDPRRDAIVASLEPRRPVERAPATTPPADSGTRRPAPAPRPAVPLARPWPPRRRAPVLRRDLVQQRTWPRPGLGRKTDCTRAGGCTRTSSDVSLAELPIDISSHVIAADIASAAAPRVVAAAPVRRAGGPRGPPWASPRWPRKRSGRLLDVLRWRDRFAIPARPVGNGSRDCGVGPDPGGGGELRLRATCQR